MERTLQDVRVGVLRGGPSEEYEVSMQTGAGMLAALANTQCQVEDIIISKKGEWLKHGIVMQPENALATTDVVLLALHGAYGEDGTVQRTLDRLSIPYTGSQAYASALAMNKLLTKQHLKEAGLKFAPHFHVTKSANSNLTRTVATITDQFGPEYVVKPLCGGSSIGTKMATSPKSLFDALEEVLAAYDDVLVEQRIRGREATCGVVENFRERALYRLPAVEIVPPEDTDFFDTEVKYNGKTEEICPSRFSSDIKKQLEDHAEAVHQTLGLRQYSRSDFIVADDGIYFLEVNTLPGLTSESLLPKSLLAVGCEYQAFITHLLTDALTNWKRA